MRDAMKDKNKNILRKVLDVYSDCHNCGAVIDDPELRKLDPYNPGYFRAVCPSCHQESRRGPFPPDTVKQIFELMADCVDLGRPILVVTLVCAAYEVSVDSFLFRLLERNNCPYDICFSVIESTDYRGKLRLIEELVGKKFKQLSRRNGFPKFFNKLEKMKLKRNRFIHKGEMHKLIDVKIGNYTIKKAAKLDASDIDEAIKFAVDVIGLFAKLFTEYGEFQPLEGYDDI